MNNLINSGKDEIGPLLNESLPDLGDSAFSVPNSQDLIYPNLKDSGDQSQIHFGSFHFITMRTWAYTLVTYLNAGVKSWSHQLFTPENNYGHFFSGFFVY